MIVLPLTVVTTVATDHIWAMFLFMWFPFPGLGVSAKTDHSIINEMLLYVATV